MIFAVLRYRDFALHWSGQVVSQIGNQLNYVALAWIVLQTTGSTAAMSGVYLAQLIPGAVLGWVAGVSVDRADRRLLMIFCDAARFVIVLALALGGQGLWAIYAVTFAVSALTMVFYTAEKTAIGQLLPEPLWTEAHAFVEASSQVAALAGPVLAGILVASLPTPTHVLYVDTATFAVSGICIALMHWRDQPRPSGGGVRAAMQEVVEGFRHLAASPFLLVVLTTAAVANFLIMPFAVLFPVLSDRVLHAGSQGFGLLMGGWGGGLLMGSLGASWLSARLSAGTLIFGGMTVLGISFGAMSAVGNLWGNVALAALGGFSVAPANAVILTMVQQRTPERMQGRVFATLLAMVTVAAPLGVALASFFLERVGVATVLLGVGVATVAAAALGALALGRVTQGSRAPDRNPA